MIIDYYLVLTEIKHDVHNIGQGLFLVLHGKSCVVVFGVLEIPGKVPVCSEN